MRTVVAILIIAGVTWWAIGGLDWVRKDEPKTSLCFSCGGPAWRCPVPGGTIMTCKICGKAWGFRKFSSGDIKRTNRVLRAAGCKPGNPSKRIVTEGMAVLVRKVEKKW